MTAINIFLKPDAAHIISDGAGVEIGTATIAAMGCKIIPIPQIPAAVILRGPLMMFPVTWLMLQKLAPSTFDDLRVVFAERLRKEWEPIFNETPMDLDIAAAGWSQREDQARFLFTTTTNIHPIRPWSLLETGDEFVLPGDESLTADFPDLAALDPVRDGLRLMQAQRKFAAGRCSVGGFVQVTTIDHCSITTRILGTWGERIGDQIRPDLQPEPATIYQSR